MKQHTKISISLPSRLLSELKKKAKKLEMPLSTYIALLLEGKIRK